jgi:hypothetical protein
MGEARPEIHELTEHDSTGAVVCIEEGDLEMVARL